MLGRVASLFGGGATSSPDSDEAVAMSVSPQMPPTPLKKTHPKPVKQGFGTKAKAASAPPCSPTPQQAADVGAYGDYGDYVPPHRHTHRGQTISRLPRAEEPKDTDEIAAVVVSISGGCSYDTLFSSVPMQSAEGTKVMGYAVDAGSVPMLLDLLVPAGGSGVDDEAAGPDTDPAEQAAAAPPAAPHGDADGALWSELQSALGVVDADCVVINFECCGTYSDAGFADRARGDTSPTMDLILRAVARGYMVMCSDFSLKALIAEWGKAAGELGPCPLVKTGGFGGTMRLKFAAEALTAVERSAQLQKVGELCTDGEANVSCPSSTIVYGVDADIAAKASASGAYTLEVLTAIDAKASRMSAPKKSLQVQAGGQTGPAGHVLLSYPTGGAILASAGHWKSLMAFDVTEEQVLAVAQEAYGDAYVSQMRSEYSLCSDASERAEKSASYARQFVQQTSPCKMKKATPQPS